MCAVFCATNVHHHKRTILSVLGLGLHLGLIFVYFDMFSLRLLCTWLSEPVQLIAWKDSSPKWHVTCTIGHTDISVRYLLTHFCKNYYHVLARFIRATFWMPISPVIPQFNRKLHSTECKHAGAQAWETQHKRWALPSEYVCGSSSGTSDGSRSAAKMPSGSRSATLCPRTCDCRHI